MTMPFFSAIPANLPIVPEGVDAPLVSAGPYYVKEWTKNRSALLVRNPHWNNAKEPWKSLARPANVDQISTRSATRSTRRSSGSTGTRPTSAHIPPAARLGARARSSASTRAASSSARTSSFWYLAHEQRQRAVQGQRRSCARRSTGRSTARRSCASTASSAAAAPTRSCRPACPATRTRRSTRWSASTTPR